MRGRYWNGGKGKVRLGMIVTGMAVVGFEKSPVFSLNW